VGGGKEQGCACQCDNELGPCCCVSSANDSDEEVETEKPTEEEAKQLSRPEQEKDSEKEPEKDLSPTTRTTTITVTEKTPRKKRLECAKMLSGRPDFQSVLWDLLDDAEGETGVAVCGPLGLSTAVRSAVVRVSEQRAVHKGTGAQGVYLHVEGFCW
jgi:ferric-chelate reductase